MSRIYLVDDHAMVRFALRRTLEMNNFYVTGESNGIDLSTDQLKDTNTEILILDVALGNESGLNLLKNISNSLGDKIKTIILTMSAQPWHFKQAMELGAMGYVLKASPVEELLDALVAVKKGRKFVDLSLERSGLSLDTDPLSALSNREIQILEKIAKGMSSHEISREIHISPKTVDTYRNRLMNKLKLKNIRDIVVFAYRHGLLNPN
jgi:DNA-binding NarL/FixJ family response regulator